MIITIIILVIASCILDNSIVSTILPIALVSLGFGIVGFIDDFKKVILKNTDGLNPKLKLLGQLLVSVIFIVYLINYTDLGTSIKVPFTDIEWNFPVWLYVPFMIFVMLGTTNAVNLTDGVDGLAGSVCTIIIGALSVIGYKLGLYGVSIFGGICAGAVCGFLIYNFHKAKVMMGDTGSLLLRRCYIKYGYLFAKSANTYNNCDCSSFRNNLRYIASCIMCSFWKENFQNGTTSSSF